MPVIGAWNSDGWSVLARCTTGWPRSTRHASWGSARLLGTALCALARSTCCTRVSPGSPALRGRPNNGSPLPCWRGVPVLRRRTRRARGCGAWLAVTPTRSTSSSIDEPRVRACTVYASITRVISRRCAPCRGRGFRRRIRCGCCSTWGQSTHVALPLPSTTSSPGGSRHPPASVPSWQGTVVRAAMVWVPSSARFAHGGSATTTPTAASRQGWMRSCAASGCPPWSSTR